MQNVVFSDEQRAILEAPLNPLVVIACAGSGKTLTIAHRLARVRKLLFNDRTYIALLSHTNVAVETFRSQYQDICRDEYLGPFNDRVVIDTLDSFFIKNVLLPHSHLVMRCGCIPYFVQGDEKFLEGFKIFDQRSKNQFGIQDIRFVPNRGGLYYTNGKNVSNSNEVTTKTLERLGKMGIYTYELGRYWIYETLKQFPEIRKVLAKRFRHILIDEAQDISLSQKIILELLEQEGTQISLIGDLNQAIYEFASATGEYLSEHNAKKAVLTFQLTRNYRSSPKIVDYANKMTNRFDVPSKAIAKRDGLYYLEYEKGKEIEAIKLFESYLLHEGFSIDDSAVLARAKESLPNAGSDKKGVGAVVSFVDAVVQRDYQNNLQKSYVCFQKGLDKLFSTKIEQEFRSNSESWIINHAYKRKIWSFIRNKSEGLPSFTEDSSEWIVLLRGRIQSLIQELQEILPEAQLVNSSIGRRITKKNLAMNLNIENDSKQLDFALSCKTVHKAKGESLEAVLYIPNQKQLKLFLNSSKLITEEARINYVALTRAKSVFCLAIQKEQVKQYQELLIRQSFNNLISVFK